VGGKPSTADILAAARAKGSAAAAKPAADEPAKPAGKPSTAEILARARAAKAATTDTPPPQAEDAVEEATADTQATPPAKPSAAAKKPASGARPTTTAEKIAWCRANDAHT
jgi:hypothetical protein